MLAVAFPNAARQPLLAGDELPHFCIHTLIAEAIENENEQTLKGNKAKWKIRNVIYRHP